MDRERKENLILGGLALLALGLLALAVVYFVNRMPFPLEEIAPSYQAGRDRS